MRDQPWKALVCGTRFGEHYLAALARRKAPSTVLSGIVARGSERSRALAEALDVALYLGVDAVPDQAADLACVALRTETFGGAGCATAAALLERGMHVLQEHPVHPGEAARLTRLARSNGLCYAVNPFYPHLPAPRDWIEYVKRAGQNGAHPPSVIEITTSPQLLYSSLDIVLRGLDLGGECQINGPFNSGDGPFHQFSGRLAGVPFTLNLQNYIDPRDPDHHSLVMHRITAVWPEGCVTLLNSFGPVVWSQSLFAEDYDRDDRASSYTLTPQDHGPTSAFGRPTAITLDLDPGRSVQKVVQEQFPIAIGRAISELRTLAQAPKAAQDDADEALFTLSDLWLQLMRRAGPPHQRSLPPPPPPFPDPTAFAKDAARHG